MMTMISPFCRRSAPEGRRRSASFPCDQLRDHSPPPSENAEVAELADEIVEHMREAMATDRRTGWGWTPSVCLAELKALDEQDDDVTQTPDQGIEPQQETDTKACD